MDLLLRRAGSDVSFDLALIERYGARVRTIDPFHIFREQAEREAAGDPRFVFLELALTTADGPLEMFRAEDPESGSLSAADLYGTGRWSSTGADPAFPDGGAW